MGSGPFDEIWTVADIQASIPKVSDLSTYLPAATMIADVQELMRPATLSATDYFSSAVTEARQSSAVLQDLRSPLAAAFTEHLGSSYIPNIADLVNQPHLNAGEVLAEYTNQLSPSDGWSEFTSRILPSPPVGWSEFTSRILPPADLDTWKSVLFNVGSPEIERSIYLAARPTIVEVAQELREMYDFSKLKVMTTWVDSPFIADSFTLDLPDESILTIPLREPRRRRRRRKPPESDTPLEKIDTTTAPTQYEPRITKKQIARVANHPYAIQIVGGTIGTVVGGIILIIIERNF